MYTVCLLLTKPEGGFHARQWLLTSKGPLKSDRETQVSLRFFAEWAFRKKRHLPMHVSLGENISH